MTGFLCEGCLTVYVSEGFVCTLFCFVLCVFGKEEECHVVSSVVCMCLSVRWLFVLSRESMEIMVFEDSCM